MMYEQRLAVAETDLRSTEHLWLPEVPLEDGSMQSIAPKPSDRYVAIDDIDSNLATLAIAPWPLLDAQGRLVFGRPRRSRVVSIGPLLEAVDRCRAKTGQVLRPLRVGDVFWIRSLVGSVARWRAMADVTEPARSAAKAALNAAVAPRLSSAEARKLSASVAEPPSPAKRDGSIGPSHAIPVV